MKVKLCIFYFLLIICTEPRPVVNIHYFPFSKENSFEKYIKVHNFGRSVHQVPNAEAYEYVPVQTSQATQFSLPAEGHEAPYQQYSIPSVQEYEHDSTPLQYGDSNKQSEAPSQKSCQLAGKYETRLPHLGEIVKHRKPSFQQHDQPYQARNHQKAMKVLTYRVGATGQQNVIHQPYIVNALGQPFKTQNNIVDRNGRNGYEEEIQEPANYIFDYIQGSVGESNADIGHGESHDIDYSPGGFYILVPEGMRQYLQNAAKNKGSISLMRYGKENDNEGIFTLSPNSKCEIINGRPSLKRGPSLQREHLINKRRTLKRKLPLKRKSFKIEPSLKRDPSKRALHIRRKHETVNIL